MPWLNMALTDLIFCIRRWWMGQSPICSQHIICLLQLDMLCNKCGGSIYFHTAIMQINPTLAPVPLLWKMGPCISNCCPYFFFFFPFPPPPFCCKMSPIYFSLGAHFEFYHQYMRNAFFKLLPLNCTDISHSGDTILFTHPALWNKHGCQNSAWVVKETFTLCFMRFPRFVAASMVVKTAVNQKSTTKLQ